MTLHATHTRSIAARTPEHTNPLVLIWHTNHELALAGITLFALLVGWIGGSVTGLLPSWGVTLAAIVAFAAGGYSGLMGAIEEAKRGKLDIDFLMIAAAIGAAAIGEWEEGALLLFLFTLSGALEEFAMERTRRAIEALAELRPETARVRQGETEINVPVNELQLGNVVLVRPGERLPIDGVVVQGNSSLDQSPITGESIPVQKQVGDPVFAGTINGSGALEVEVEKLAGESTLSKIIILVEEAQQASTPTQKFIDRFSQPYTYVVIGGTLLAILLPLLFGNEPFSDTLYRAMTLLVVASPCALIISTPASVLSAIAAAARNGILLKGGAYLEKLAAVRIIAFDKTGTLTHGKPTVTDIEPLNGTTADQLLRIAASAELYSEHHLGQAIVSAAHARGLSLDKPTEFHAVPGHGIQAQFDRGDYRETIYIGNNKLFTSEAVAIAPAVHQIEERLQQQGKTAMLVARQRVNKGAAATPQAWEMLGFLAVADSVRPEAKLAVASLRAAGIERVVMLTGDNQAVAEAIAQDLGITETYSELLPQQKVEILRELVNKEKTAMVGDGINDAPALAVATVGIAMGAGGTDVALETADVVLMASDLSKLSFALTLGRQAERIVQQNVIFSVSVIVALVIATILLPALVPGFVLPLPLGVVGHEGSTLLVVANGLRMLALRPSEVAA